MDRFTILLNVNFTYNIPHIEKRISFFTKKMLVKNNFDPLLARLFYYF